MFCRFVAALSFAAALPPQLVAQVPPQRRFALSGAWVLENGDQAIEWGLRLAAGLTYSTRSDFAMRFDASYMILPRGAYATIGCGGGLKPCPTGEATRVLQLGLTGAWVDRDGIVVSLGAGLYDALETPFDGAYLAPGYSLGLNMPLGSALFFDMTWHGILGPGSTLGFLPMSIGVRF